MEFHELERAKKHIKDLGNLHNGIRKEMLEVRKWSGSLFMRSIRLSRTVREGWDRNVSLEIQVKHLKVEACKARQFEQTVEDLRSRLVDLKAEAFSAFSEFKQLLQSASQMLNAFLQHATIQRDNQAGTQVQSSESTELCSQESFSSATGQFQSQIAISPSRTFGWTYEDGENWVWYRTSSLAMFPPG